jgi:hypothetical protein
MLSATTETDRGQGNLKWKSPWPHSCGNFSKRNEKELQSSASSSLILHHHPSSIGFRLLWPFSFDLFVLLQMVRNGSLKDREIGSLSYPPTRSADLAFHTSAVDDALHPSGHVVPPHVPLLPPQLARQLWSLAA